MGYFDGLVSGSFKKDEAGRTVFFPLGIMGKGRVAPTEGDADALRSALKTYYLAALPAVIAVAVIFGFWASIALAAVAVAYFQFWISAKARDWPISGERLSYAESTQNVARGAGKGVVIALLVLSLLFVAAGLFLLTLPEAQGTALMAILIFGACSVIFLYMLRQHGRT